MLSACGVEAGGVVKCKRCIHTRACRCAVPGGEDGTRYVRACALSKMAIWIGRYRSARNRRQPGGKRKRDGEKNHVARRALFAQANQLAGPQFFRVCSCSSATNPVSSFLTRTFLAALLRRPQRRHPDETRNSHPGQPILFACRASRSAGGSILCAPEHSRQPVQDRRQDKDDSTDRKFSNAGMGEDPDDRDDRERGDDVHAGKI